MVSGVGARLGAIALLLVGLFVVRVALGHSVTGEWNLRSPWQGARHGAWRLDWATRLYYAGLQSLVCTVSIVWMTFAFTQARYAMLLLLLSPLLFLLLTGAFFVVLSMRDGRAGDRIRGV
jgi:hypothetical protein